jgi:hypothetical protein
MPYLSIGSQALSETLPQAKQSSVQADVKTSRQEADCVANSPKP